MTSKFSRAALVAGLAIGASGLVAVPAEAANGVSTANYYVNNPAIGPASNITPESATVTASIDTGGSPESILPVPSTGLLWSSLGEISISPELWNDGTAPAVTAASPAAYAPVDGLPVSGSNSNVSVTITDKAITNSGVTDSGITNSGVPGPVSNGGADNYSDVTFEYDPVSDYVANGNTPGSEVQFAQDIQVPTTAGVSSVSDTIGAFGQAAQSNSGNTPLMPGTKYYYWVIQQAGGTDAASNINVSAWTGATTGTPAAPTNNVYKCYPNAAIAADPTLNSYLQPGATVNYGGQTLPADQGPCIYYYGDTNGSIYYQSPNGEFTTPAIGTIRIGGKATVTGSSATLSVTNASAYLASGTIELMIGHDKLVGKAKYRLKPHGSEDAKIVLTARGTRALAAHKRVKIAPISSTATVASTSNWDQPFSRKTVKF